MSISSAPFPLFHESSSQLLSPAFYVAPGDVMLFQAFDFEDTPRAVDPDEGQVIPAACLRQILLQSPGDLKELLSVGGTGVFNSSLRGAGLAEGPVISEDCPWELSACQTVALLDIPGVWRLELNDPASLGQARVYVRALEAGFIRRPSRLYFGEV